MACLGQFLVRSLLLSLGSWFPQGFVCALQESVSPVLCKLWGLYGGVNNDLLQEDLRHTRTQSPCSAALLPQETLKHSSGCLCGVPGSWCAQGLFEPSEHLCREWGLILNANSPLLPSCWGFSFAPGCKISPQSHFSTAQPLFHCLPSY